jgi:sphingomyelin phosphodiesterase
MQFVLGYGKLVADIFLQTFNDTNIPIYYALGNHDVFPVDQLDPRAPSILQPLGSYWSKFLPSDALASFQSRGYYTILLRKGLRLVVLNTQYEDPINFFLYRGDVDPGKQLTWLTQVLTAAEHAQEKVFILGHIPPGIVDRGVQPESLPNFNTNFSRIVEQFQHTVVAQFYGHTHQDCFRLFQDSKYEQATSVAYITPAVTPWEIQNPSGKLMNYKINMKFVYSPMTRPHLNCWI